jgi:hypothetical protein
MAEALEYHAQVLEARNALPTGDTTTYTLEYATVRKLTVASSIISTATNQDTFQPSIKPLDAFTKNDYSAAKSVIHDIQQQFNTKYSDFAQTDAADCLDKALDHLVDRWNHHFRVIGVMPGKSEKPAFQTMASDAADQHRPKAKKPKERDISR